MNPYVRFAAMIVTSTIVMFGLMYLNTYQLDHIFWSQTRAWMALLMGATMAIVMLAFMQHMLSKRGLNLAIFVGSALVFAVSLWLVRSQVTVDQVSWMRAMIPHHSIAILTSRRAQHRGSARAQARRRHHRGAGARDRRDEDADRRTRPRPLSLPRRPDRPPWRHSFGAGARLSRLVPDRPIPYAVA